MSRSDEEIAEIYLKNVAKLILGHGGRMSAAGSPSTSVLSFISANERNEILRVYITARNSKIPEISSESGIEYILIEWRVGEEDA